MQHPWFLHRNNALSPSAKTSVVLLSLWLMFCLFGGLCSGHPFSWGGPACGHWALQPLLSLGSSSHGWEVRLRSQGGIGWAPRPELGTHLSVPLHPDDAHVGGPPGCGQARSCPQLSPWSSVLGGSQPQSCHGPSVPAGPPLCPFQEGQWGGGKTRAGCCWAAQRVLRPVTAIRKEGNTAATVVHTSALASARPRRRPYVETLSLGFQPQGGPGGASPRALEEPAPSPQPLRFTLGRDPGLSFFRGSLLRHPLPCHPHANP